MLISSGINVMEAPNLEYSDFTLTWSFGGNSSLISLCGNDDGVVSSEHWITDCSDIFSFDTKGKLANLGLSVPNKNHHIDIKIRRQMFGRFTLSGEKLYTVPPMPMRMFDPLKRKLTCFNELSINSDVFYLKLRKDFGMLLSDENYCGYIIDNPISYFTDEINGYVDTINLPDDAEYDLMSRFLKIMSDNNVEKHNENIEQVIMELSDKIMPSVNLIKSDFRKNVVKSTIQELLEFYC